MTDWGSLSGISSEAKVSMIGGGAVVGLLVVVVLLVVVLLVVVVVGLGRLVVISETKACSSTLAMVWTPDTSSSSWLSSSGPP